MAANGWNSWSQVPGPGPCSLPGAWSLVPGPGPWSLVPGPWSLVPGPWSLVPGPWSLVLVLNPWSLVPSPWSLVPGPWSSAGARARIFWTRPRAFLDKTGRIPKQDRADFLDKAARTTNFFSNPGRRPGSPSRISLVRVHAISRP